MQTAAIGGQCSRLKSHNASKGSEKSKRCPVFEIVKNKLIFNEENVKGINDMINMELYASYTYMSMVKLPPLSLLAAIHTCQW